MYIKDIGTVEFPKIDATEMKYTCVQLTDDNLTSEGILITFRTKRYEKKKSNICV